jgi:hypothetical protein
LLSIQIPTWEDGKKGADLLSLGCPHGRKL